MYSRRDKRKIGEKTISDDAKETWEGWRVSQLVEVRGRTTLIFTDHAQPAFRAHKKKPKVGVFDHFLLKSRILVIKLS